MVEAANFGCFLILRLDIVAKGERYGKTKEKKKNRVEVTTIL